MALPATDSFTASDGTALTTYSANWTLNSGNFDIQSNSLRSNTGGTETAAHWDADAFNADQYAQCVASVLDTGSGRVGVAVRCNTGGTANYYGAYWSSASCEVFKVVSGVFTQLGAAFSAPSTNDVVRLEVSGTTLTLKYNGSSQGTRTDSDLASGAAGVSGYDSGNNGRIDSWEGGNLGGGGGGSAYAIFYVRA